MGNHKVLKTAGINLRYSMYEFISAVKLHPIIYDREHEDFHNRELRDQAWQKIGQQLCKDFDAASCLEKQLVAKTLLKRWKNTRDSYLRVNRLRQSGEEITRASYIYEKELNFLLDVKNESVKIEQQEQDKSKLPAKRKRFTILRAPVKRDPGSPRSTRDEDAECGSTFNEGLHSVLEGLNYAEDTSTQPTSPLPKNEVSTFVVGFNNRSTQPTSPSPSQLPLPKNEVTTFAVDFNDSTLNNSSANSNPLVAADPDQAFFESIKPHMQKMSSDQKLDFQIEVLKILRNFKPNPN